MGSSDRSLVETDSCIQITHPLVNSRLYRRIEKLNGSVICRDGVLMEWKGDGAWSEKWRVEEVKEKNKRT